MKSGTIRGSRGDLRLLRQELRHLFHSPSLLLMIVIVAGIAATAPTLVLLAHTESATPIHQRLVSRLTTGDPVLHLWFTRIYLPLTGLIVPVMLAAARFRHPSFRDALILHRLRGTQARSLYATRFVAAAITLGLISLGGNALAMLRLVRTTNFTMVPRFMAGAYLSMLCSVFAFSLASLLHIVLRTRSRAVLAGTLLILVMQLPILLAPGIPHYPASLLSPFAYITHIIHMNPGDMAPFVHAATIVFIAILIPYFIAMRRLTITANPAAEPG